MTRKHRILIVDDQPINLKILEKTLEADYDTVTASSGQQALDLVATQAPDLILLDVMMPGLSGHDVILQLKNNPATAAIPIIFITARDESSSEETGLRLGAIDYITKPFEPAIARQRVHNQILLIEEREKREALIHSLENKNAELENFANIISHDLRSPLVTVQGFLGYLRQSHLNGNTDRFEADYQRILHTFERMQHLLGTLLDYARANQDKIPREPMTMDLPLDQALENLAGVLPPRTVVKPEEPWPQISGSELHLTQVWQNLLENCWKYRAPDRPLEIKVNFRRQGTGTVFSVQDNGIGVAPDKLPRVFNAFERLGQKGSGVGLGLALVRKIVEAHGGRIWAESPGLGHGTTILFTVG